METGTTHGGKNIIAINHPQRNLKDKIFMSTFFKNIKLKVLGFVVSLTIANWLFFFCLFQMIAFYENNTYYDYTKVWPPKLDVNLLDILLFGPFAEEWVFRKVLINFLEKRVGIFIACFTSGLIFSAAHAYDFTILSFTNISHMELFSLFVRGVVYAIIYVRTRKLIYPTFAHMLENFIVILPKYFLYIENTGLSYWPYAITFVLAGSYLLYEGKNTFLPSRIQIRRATL